LEAFGDLLQHNGRCVCHMHLFHALFMPTKRKYGAIIAYVDIFFDDYRIFYTKSVTCLVHIQ